jgi:hypothetical protein
VVAVVERGVQNVHAVTESRSQMQAVRKIRRGEV